MSALLNPVVPVFMMKGTPEPDREKSSLNTTPTSTPRQPRLVSSSQPTSRQHLTLDQRVRRRIRRFSLMSDASENSLNSRSSVGSKDKLKTTRDYKPKAITEIGKHQLDPMKKQCTGCYVDDFLNTYEADDLLDKRKSEFFKSSTNKEESTLDLDQSTPRDTSLHQRIYFLKTKIQKTTEQVFKLSSQISKVVIRRLPTCKKQIPYESMTGKDDMGPNPHISILSLGVPRPLSLKKGSRVTHKVALNQGSLCVLSENTSMEYTFSIPRGNSNSNEHEQLLLFFIRSPSIKTEEDSDHSILRSYNPRSSSSRKTHPRVR